jgi:transcriptional regulator with XRE-family HTH domain
VSSSPSPVVANWELVLRLKDRREHLGISVNDLTGTLGFSRNYWSAIENERKIIPETTLRRLFETLEFDKENREQLLELHAAAKENGWWNKYSSLFDSKLQRLYGLEHGAQKIRWYETLLIPGLLQTADYARAVINSDATVRQVEVEQRVAVRLHRQERLRDDNPVKLIAIMSEAALRQQIGGKSILEGQLAHLLDVIEENSDNVEIKIIPFTAGACHIYGAGTLQILSFQSPRLPPAIWVETVSTWAVITKPTQVRDITEAFTNALDLTLDRQQTRDLIKRHKTELLW